MHTAGGTFCFFEKQKVHAWNIPKAKISHALRVGLGLVRCVCMSIRAKTPSVPSPSPYSSLSHAQSLTLARPHTLALLSRTASLRLIPLSDDGRPIQGAKPILVGAGPLDGSNWSRPACLPPSGPSACSAPPFSPTSLLACRTVVRLTGTTPMSRTERTSRAKAIPRPDKATPRATPRGYRPTGTPGRTTTCTATVSIKHVASGYCICHRLAELCIRSLETRAMNQAFCFSAASGES
jgi:hypothetical protein